MVAWIRDRHAAAGYWRALARAPLDAADQRGFAGEVARVPFESLVPAPESVPVTLVDHRYVLGGLGPAELIVLCRLARSADPKTIFEFGTFLGATTLQLAANTAAEVYTLDLPRAAIPRLSRPTTGASRTSRGSGTGIHST